MADPRALVAGRYAFAGSLKNSQTVERWIGVESDTGRRVVLLAADAGRLTTLDSARGVKHRHLTGVIDVVREVDAASLPSGRALPPGFGVAIAEFVPGKTLHGELLQTGMNPSKAVAWILRLADAVQALHAAGAVHAALSPRSVIAVPEGRAIAPVLSQLVAPGIGPFCPPERLKGSVETSSDDVWALHATLYAALTRQAPFNAPSRDALLKQMLSGRPKPLSAFGIDEPALQEILDRGLAYEKRVRVTELAELVQTLDGWERDPRAMPPKRQVPPRPATRSLMDIVGATGLGKDRDDGIVIDDATLLEDEGAELNPKPLVPPMAAPPAPNPALAPPPAPAPGAPTHDALGSVPNLLAAGVATPPGTVAPAAPIQKRLSINPFERKRSVWPLVLIAAIAGGGGVYLAVAPDAPPPKVVAEEVAPPLPQPKPPQPERPKLSPGEARDACVASYFDPGAFGAAQSFSFVCEDGDFREVSSRLQQLARPVALSADAAARAGFGVTSRGRRCARLGAGLVRAARGGDHPQILL